LPAISAISQEILNQPYRVPRKPGKKKHPVWYAVGVTKIGNTNIPPSYGML
jgi:hypothetical protein